MVFSAKTDIGLKRKINQDSYNFKAVDENCAWMVVCDGMGGMAAGNIASAETVKLLTRSFRDNLSAKSKPEFVRNFLKNSIQSVNAAVFEEANSSDELKGMGTTIVCAVILNDVCYVAHAGDSRLYRLHSGVLSQVTNDHSVVQSMVDNGQITEEQAKIHPNKNIITRAVGVHSEIEVDFTEFHIFESDIILLCTDGLTNCVNDSEIVKVLKEEKFENIAEKLTEIANNNGGFDNITAVAVKV